MSEENPFSASLKKKREAPVETSEPPRENEEGGREDPKPVEPIDAERSLPEKKQVLFKKPPVEKNASENGHSEADDGELPSMEFEEDRDLPPLSMDETSCRSCKFYSFGDEFERVHSAKGQCRRNAPRPGRGLKAEWPTVTWQQWCGQWENGVSNEDMVRMARDIGENM